jgi:two-component system, OmpR family, response regulator RegX3
MSVAPLTDPRGQAEHASGARPTLLVVDDEVSYRDALDVGLTHEGYRVVTAASIAEARAAISTTTPHLILLDVMLPDGSGIDFCRELAQSSTTPIIMVSARTSEVDVVLGLEIGAADYVTKPYRLRELVARIRAVLRRPAPANEPDTISFGNVTIDLVRRRVTRGDEVIEMSRKEFDLLSLFGAHLGDVVTREVCLDTLWWGLDLADSRTLDTHVKRLRQKIEETPATPRHLVTVRGVGFRLDP